MAIIDRYIKEVKRYKKLRRDDSDQLIVSPSVSISIMEKLLKDDQWHQILSVKLEKGSRSIRIMWRDKKRLGLHVVFTVEFEMRPIH